MTDVQKPLRLNELVEEPLPFHELDEIIVAFRTAEDITEDAIAQLDEHLARYRGPDDANLQALRRQLADMAHLRKHYTARLVNLATRLPERNEQGHAITALGLPADNGEPNAALVEALAAA